MKRLVIESDDDAFERAMAERSACPYCGTPDAWSVANGECGAGQCQSFFLDHCGAFFKLIQRRFKPAPESIVTFDPGYPDTRLEPGEPAQVLCPLCMDEEEGELHACYAEGCPFEPLDVGFLLNRAWPHERAKAQEAWRAWATGASDDAAFVASFFPLVRVRPTLVLNKQGLVVHDVRRRGAGRPPPAA